VENLYHTTGTVYSELKILATSGDSWILGLNFFENYYTIFD
jgi:hypothetical protein